MSFWRVLASWATKMEEKAAESRARFANRLSRAEFRNTMNAFEGVIGRMFEVGGGLVKQHISICSNDLIKIAQNMLDQFRDKQEAWLDTTYKLYDSAMQARFREAETMNVRRFNAVMNTLTELHKRQNIVIDALRAVTVQAGMHESNNANRYLEVLERVRLADDRSENSNNVHFNTMLTLHEHLTEQINRKQQVVVEPNQPTFAWLIDNLEELMTLTDALKAARDNNTPESTATMHAVRSIRAMMPDVSMELAEDVLKYNIQQWQNAA